ncbi:DUF4258 domain-containing protein [Corynebacterium accolens]|uniref:DUF4258 domain-containing protein n=1 Tax=Corynebacterium accolens TaxID=38284 RepID=UPI002543C525|nr:DUF4258 domain-containing protein [Corynebacterium accolens]MDK4266586.1 DUF4258 domain-containing protein [Corynebacterium accolens]MDK4309847.1 DUF4258 domain-containing protein [Corynebacterium accolens]
MPNDLYIWPHARRRMRERNITEDDIRYVLDNYQISRPGNTPNRTVYEADLGKVTCVVTVNDSNPTEVVTAFNKRT